MERGNDINNGLEARWKEGSWPNLRYQCYIHLGGGGGEREIEYDKPQLL
jgi:hypothetical protein